MTRSNKKAGCGGDIDRISDLPSNIIDGILEHLDIEDMVRTSILSRKWRYMWVSVPRLEFDGTFFENNTMDNEDHEICSIITEVLLLHNGPVYEFTLEIPFQFSIRTEWLSKCILFLSTSGIKNLKLKFGCCGKGPYKVPSHIFSCQELTHFELYGFNLSVPPPNFCGFKNLYALHFHYVRFESGALEKFVSGCPLLEELDIRSCYNLECIDISAPNLKVLRITNDFLIKPICLKKAKNLIDLELVASLLLSHERVRASDVIKGLPKIQRLIMAKAYIEILSTGTIPLTLRRSFSSLEHLELRSLDFTNGEQVLFVVNLLKSTPNLVQLVIKGQYYGAQVPDDFYYEDFEDSCCLSKLEKVNISLGATYKGDRFENQMSLIQYILANSSSLKTLTFDVVHLRFKHDDAPMLLSISQDLLRMERASQRAEINFLYGNLKVSDSDDD